ncbi:MAG: ABC transporter substrate-binding protein [Gluconacetobacter diazotrophicus]|nr:ABC transporter substrate-binding protein [Gluconacetobacter diazotrophicus]
MRTRSTIAAVAMLAFPLPAIAAGLPGPVGISVGSLGNPYYVALAKGATAQARALDPNAAVTVVSADYDLNKQFTQMDNFVAAGVKLILVTAIDQNAIRPAIERAHRAGIVVVGVDVNAEGADAVIQTNNVAAGTIACEALAAKIGGKGDVIIENGEQVSAVIDRVKGCEAALAKHPDIRILDSGQNGKGSRDGALAVAQGYMVRFPDIAGIFAVNDPQAIGTDLAIAQAHRTGIVVTSVDGAPDIVSALKTDTANWASASQDPYRMGQIAVRTGTAIADHHLPAERVILMPPKLVDRKNVSSYVGWTQH